MSARFPMSDRRWRVLAWQLKRAADMLCQRCGRAGRLEAHHIVPLSEGGAMYDPDNIEVLCRDCHINHHRHECPSTHPERKLWLEAIENFPVKTAVVESGNV